MKIILAVLIMFTIAHARDPADPSIPLRDVDSSKCINCIPQDILNQENNENNVAVVDLSPNNITSGDALVLTQKIQSDLINLNKFKVIEREQLYKILAEQNLQVGSSDAIIKVIKTGHILGIRKIVTGNAGLQDDSDYFYSLKLVDVESGEILKSTYIIIKGEYDDFVNASDYAVRKLLGLSTKRYRVIKIKGERPVQEIIKKEVIQEEVHVYHHKATEPHSTFIPCSFCQGTGLVNGKSCPMCHRSITYSGAETNYQPMTGHWRRE